MASSTDLQRLVVQLEVRQGQLERGFAAAERRTSRSLGNIDKRIAVSARAMQRNLGPQTFSGFISAIGSLDGPLGGGVSRIGRYNAVLSQTGPAAATAALGIGALALSAGQIGALADKFTRFENRLKTAGVEGERLATVGDRLFEVANRNGVEIEALGSVYARASLSANELGATEQNLDTFVSAVSDALRVQGSSAEASRGALLQLSQAIGQDIVRAEEFNSILEGALPIAQAAARGMTRFGGSVAQLRTAIINGEVTSREFFEGIIRDAPNLAAQAAKANLTLENSFTALYNQLARGIGRTDKSLEASQRLSEGILFLADNLDTLGEAITVISAALGARFVSSLAAAGAAQASFYAKALRGNQVIIGGARATEQKALADKLAAKEALQAAEAERARAAATVQAVQADIAAQNARRAALGNGVYLTDAGRARYMAREIELSRDLAAAKGVLATATDAEAAATARATAAEVAHDAALKRTTLSARAAAVAQRAYAALSGVLGGPLGIGLTALAATYVIVSSRTAAAAERTKALQEELRELGYLAPDVSDKLDDTADAMERLAADQIRAKLRDAKQALDDLLNSGPLTSLSAIFGGDLALDQVEFLARQLRSNVSPAMREAGSEVEAIASGLRDGTLTADELDRRLRELAARDLGEGVDRLIGRLREIGPTIIASFPYLDELDRRLENAGSRRFDASRQSAGRGGPSLGEISARQGFLTERNRVAGLDEETRAVEKLADAIQKEAEEAKVSLSRTQALAQARRELAIENERSAASKRGEEIGKARDADRQIVEELQRSIEIFGDERTQAMDRAAESLSKYASPEQVARVRELAAAYYDLGVAEQQAEARDDSGAREAAIEQMRQEADLIGLTGAKLAEQEFFHERLNQKRAAGIPITREVIEAVRAEAEAYGQAAAEILKTNQRQLDQIAVQDEVRQGLIDIGLAATRGADDFGDAVGDMLRRIADLILELYVLKPLIESVFAAQGTSGNNVLGAIGAGLSALIGFKDGGVMTPSGPRQLKRYSRGGVSNRAAIFGEAGPEAAVPLPDGRRIPVDLRLPDIRRPGPAAASQNLTIAVTVDGANGDQHVIALVNQGVAQGLREYDKQLGKTMGARMVVAQKRQL